MDMTEAEGAVLGAMLIDAKAVPSVLSTLTPEDFDGETHRALFTAIRDLYRTGAPVDPVTAVDRAGWAQDKAKRAFVAELMEITPTSSNVAEYVRIVREQATLRRLHMEADVMRLSPSLDECRARIAAMTEALGSGESVEAWSMGQMLTDFGDRQIAGGKRDYVGIGIAEIDANTYLERGDVMMIGGAPSDGKTALALCCAYHMAATLNVGFYSLETRREKLEDRLIASSFGISFDAIKKGRLTEADWETFAKESIEAEKRRLTVLHASGMTADQITGSARARGFDAIFIDYGQLITPSTAKGASRAEQMADVSKTLHTFAQTTRTLVIVLLQLTRQDRKDKRERDMFDLGETSQWEKDADLILLLYRPPEGTRFIEGDNDSEELDPDTTRILRIAKQKEGKRVRLPMLFDGDHQRFSVMAPDGRYALRKYVAAGREIKEKNRREGIAKQMQFPEIQETGDEPF